MDVFNLANSIHTECSLNEAEHPATHLLFCNLPHSLCISNTDRLGIQKMKHIRLMLNNVCPMMQHL